MKNHLSKSVKRAIARKAFQLSHDTYPTFKRDLEAKVSTMAAQGASEAEILASAVLQLPATEKKS